MEIGVTLLVIAVLVIAIWIVIEMKRMRHKMLALFLIGLVLFSYFSFSFVLKGQEINFKSIDGIRTASTLYFSWLGAVFLNFKSITAKVINMNWKGNETETEETG